jgi:hypothetical protein
MRILIACTAIVLPLFTAAAQQPMMLGATFGGKPEPGSMTTLAEARATTRPDTVKEVDLSGQQLTEVPAEVFRFRNLGEADPEQQPHCPAARPREPAEAPAGAEPFGQPPRPAPREVPAQPAPANPQPPVQPTGCAARGIARNKALTQLVIGNNKLTQLKGSQVKRWRNLREINLYNNKLTALPAEIGRLRHLTTLDLYRNDLTTLPESVTGLQTCRCWPWPTTGLDQSAAGLGQLTGLTALYCHHNQLHRLPESTASLQS